MHLYDIIIGGITIANTIILLYIMTRFSAYSRAIELLMNGSVLHIKYTNNLVEKLKRNNALTKRDITELVEEYENEDQ